MNICVSLIFMFLIHYCCRYYTNDIRRNNETALPQNSNEVIPGENVKGQSLQHTNITQTRRIKREVTSLVQLFIVSCLIIFPSDFILCVNRYHEYSNL